MKLVITDLDGTLLDQSTYSFDDAREALEVLKRHGVPLIFCTSKTRAETEVWRRLLANRHPFIVENGGAVAIPPAYFAFPPPFAVRRAGCDVIEVGTPYPDLVRTLGEASRESNCRVRGFSDMTVEEVARECEMSADQAALAKEREYDEPFVILDAGRAEELLAAIRESGKRWTRGDRFYHITGNNDKAKAMQLLVDLYRRTDPEVLTIGVGDGCNDAAFLRITDISILVRSPSLPELMAEVPHGIPTEHPGPRGWNQALLGIFS